MKKILLIAALIWFPMQANAETAENLLKALAQKTQADQPNDTEVRKAHDALKAQFPNSEEAAIGDAAFIWYLVEAPKTSLQEAESLFNALKAKGESKWYVAFARLGLISFYGMQNQQSQAKNLAQQGMSIIDWSAVDQSYISNKDLMGRCFGPTYTAVSRTSEWRDEMTKIANDP